LHPAGQAPARDASRAVVLNPPDGGQSPGQR
jgi:hypothetical protein